MQRLLRTGNDEVANLRRAGGGHVGLQAIGRCQRRPSDPAARGERCEHMNEVTILAPNEVVEQLEASERLPQDIDPDTLRKYFTLTRPDLEQVDQCRGVTNKLSFAVQLCTLRWRGHFLRDTREIP